MSLLIAIYHFDTKSIEKHTMDYSVVLWYLLQAGHEWWNQANSRSREIATMNGLPAPPLAVQVDYWLVKF